MLTLKILFLFIAIWFSIINIGKLIKKSYAPMIGVLIHAIGITGFIVLQWLI